MADDRGSGARRALPGEGSGMSGVEELAEQLAVAVKALEEIANPECMLRGGLIDMGIPARIAEDALATLRGAA
jgi:hypothetical protein